MIWVEKFLLMFSTDLHKSNCKFWYVNRLFVYTLTVFVISSPQINRPSFSFAAPGESSMSSGGVLELGMSDEGEFT